MCTVKLSACYRKVSMIDMKQNLDFHETFNRNNMRILNELSHSRDGESPLSFSDLIDRGTFDLELAAWLMSHVSRGASFIVGAGPGGVGKTTTMRSLLSLAPSKLPFGIALPEKIANTYTFPHCIISHELSDHRPPGYLWGQDLREFFNLSEQGHMLVGNMHVDDLDEAHGQICESNDVPLIQFRSINLFIFLRVEGEDRSTRRINNPSARRITNEIYYSDGVETHKLVYTCDKGLLENTLRDLDYETSCRAFLKDTLANLPLTIEETRHRFLDWEETHNRSF